MNRFAKESAQHYGKLPILWLTMRTSTMMDLGRRLCIGRGSADFTTRQMPSDGWALTNFAGLEKHTEYVQ